MCSKFVPSRSGIALTALFVIGLYLHLRERSPRAAFAVLVWGVVGLASHLLIPLGFWLTIPGFVQWGARDMTAAGNAWMAFWNVCNSAQGVGSPFDGLAMLATGIALMSEPGVRPFAAIAIVAGGASVSTVAAAETPVQGSAALVYLPMIALTAVFRSWGGVVVERNAAHLPLERTINA
ncbi:MAG TPA: hypothetical protein VN651_02035 [Gemmatimonadaceae bacterium]|nr:hypothetical protein [Gemmatimonadaceae bacterium]